MPELRICAEINGLGEDENGKSCPGGIMMTLGDFPEDGFQKNYNQLMNRVTPESFLKAVGLLGVFQPQDCRIITPEEYDILYGDDE